MPANYSITFYTRHIEVVEELFEASMGYLPDGVEPLSGRRFTWRYESDKRWLDSRSWFNHAGMIELVSHVVPKEEEVGKGVDF